jgi:exosortase E/protease (VPEID-CTERM system)
LLPVGIVSIWLCNVVRIVALILIGAHISPAIAVGGFHSQAGWIGFAAVTMVIGFVALRSPLTAKCEAVSDRASSRVVNPTTAFLMPFMAMVAAAMIVAAFSSGFDTLYPLKIMVGLVVLAYFLPIYWRMPWSWSWLAAANGIAVFAIWLGLERFAIRDGTQLADGLQQLAPIWGIVWLACRAIGSAAVVPIAEELAFRGYLMRRISAADFDAMSYRQCSWLAVLISSLLFGLLHGRWIAGTLAGIFYALASRRRNMLCDAVTAHSVTNGLIAAYVVLTDSWQLWS